VQEALLRTGDLDPGRTYLLKYCLDMYEVAVKPETAYQLAWQNTLCSSVIQLGAGFKICRDGMVTVMSGEGYVLANWLGCSGLRVLLPHLTALGLRLLARGEVSNVDVFVSECYYSMQVLFVYLQHMHLKPVAEVSC
jgi:hypothetical protein